MHTIKHFSTRPLGLLVVMASMAISNTSQAVDGEFRTAEEKKSSPKEVAIDLGKGIKMELVLIPAGEFMMGAPDSEKGALSSNERPQHKVRITRPFYLGKYAVTQEQWEFVMGNNPSHYKGPRNPVEMVSWSDCQKFLNLLSLLVGGGKFKMSTEAQWEYACRARTTTRFSFGSNESDLAEYAWYGRNAPTGTHPVGQKKPNPWGLYDMHGNVGTWCSDWYERDYYTKSPTDDPTGPVQDGENVCRGGAWLYHAGWCRSSLRSHGAGGIRSTYVGLRVVRDVETKPN